MEKKIAFRIFLFILVLVSIPLMIQLEVFLLNGGSGEYYLAMFLGLSAVPTYCFIFYSLIRSVLCLKK